jgi:uncharacterized LabA/DUF88 family protein
MKRVAVFIDGFNLHHAVDNLKKDHLKWLDLRKLARVYAPSSHYEITSVFYFSAYATWIHREHQRHKTYVEALRASGVTPILGHFNKKEASCSCCDHKWIKHEEKQSDVNLALYILNEAYKNSYDTAFIVSADSDLAPAIRMTKAAFPEKKFKILTPPTKKHCLSLVDAANTKPAYIKEIHLERCLLPEVIALDNGETVIRPVKFDPPEEETLILRF